MFDRAQPSWSEVWTDEWRAESATIPLVTGASCGPERVRNEAVIDAARAVDLARLALADSVGDWDDAAAWSADGARSAGAWLRSNLALTYGHGMSVLRIARSFRRHELLRDAVADGRLPRREDQAPVPAP